jgi:hypothetical protein
MFPFYGPIIVYDINSVFWTIANRGMEAFAPPHMRQVYPLPQNIDPRNISRVHRLINNNLEIYLTNTVESIIMTDDWHIEFYTPQGEVDFTLHRSNFDTRALAGTADL